MWKQRRGHREDRGRCGGCDDHDSTSWAFCREDGTELGVGIADRGRGIGEHGTHPATPPKGQVWRYNGSLLVFFPWCCLYKLPVLLMNIRQGWTMWVLRGAQLP